MRINRIFSVLPALLFTGVVATAVAAEKTMVDSKAVAAQQEIDAAEKARAMAASVDSEWTTTGKLIKSAQSALKAGNYDEAIMLAKRASEEGALSYEQGASQKELRIPSYLKY